MYITINLKCSFCDHTEEKFIDKMNLSDAFPCPKCDGPLVRTPSAPQTTFKFADTSPRKKP